MAYGVWHKCCCAGGCNGWTQTGDEPAGFNPDDTQTACDSCGTGWAPGAGGDPSSPCCCGPEVPISVDFDCSTAWAFAWNREPQACFCMGPPGDASTPDDPPVASTPCPTGNTNLDVWEYDAGATNSGAWWIDAGAVDMTLEPDNQAAIDADDEAVNHPASCCATYYYGKCDLTGPATPSFTDNPWGYGLGYFGDSSTRVAPTALEAFGRLSLIFAGEDGTLRLRATLSVFFAIKGVTLTSGGTLDHYTDLPDIPTTARRPVLRWVCDSSIDVAEGCSCNFGYGQELVDLLNWGAITEEGSYWTKQHLYPVASHSPATAVYTTTPGIGGPSLDYPCGDCGRDPCDCTAETFSLNNVSGCDGCSSLGCPETAIWYALDNASNVTRAYPADYVLAAASRDGVSSDWIPMPGDPTDFGWADSGNSYAASGFGDSGGRAWRTHSFFDSVPCIAGGGSRNTLAMRGGFVGGSPIYQPGVGAWMPSSGLSDVAIVENFPP